MPAKSARGECFRRVIDAVRTGGLSVREEAQGEVFPKDGPETGFDDRFYELIDKYNIEQSVSVIMEDSMRDILIGSHRLALPKLDVAVHVLEGHLATTREELPFKKLKSLNERLIDIYELTARVAEDLGDVGRREQALSSARQITKRLPRNERPKIAPVILPDLRGAYMTEYSPADDIERQVAILAATEKPLVGTHLKQESGLTTEALAPVYEWLESSRYAEGLDLGKTDDMYGFRIPSYVITQKGQQYLKGCRLVLASRLGSEF